MLSINTNISSYIAQRSLKNSTQLLNQAIERMTTGYKLNHAKDNAANFSISTNQTTKLSAYQVAEDNVSMGLDLLTTANDNLNLISNHLTRIRDLTTQAGNGTYGEQLLNAIRSEVNSRVEEINRLYSTAEYNGIKLFEETSAPTFIKEVVKRDTSTMTALSSVDETQTLAKGTYSISTADDMAKLARMTNNKLLTSGSEFVLANDIDLSAYSSGEGWKPIGDKEENSFNGTFDGNGYVISNLTINNYVDYGTIHSNPDYSVPDSAYNCGLFGFAQGELKNIGLENVNIACVSGAPLVVTFAGTCSNCYSTGNIKSAESVGGLIAVAGNVSSSFDVFSANISDCFSTCDVYTDAEYAGGLIRLIQDGSVTNCYATGDVKCGECDVGGVAGLIFSAYGVDVIECFSTGDVYGHAGIVSSGGLINEFFSGRIENCYTTGNIFDGNGCGAFVNNLGDAEVKNCYATGDIISYGECNSFINSTGSSTISDCYYTGNIKTECGGAGLLYSGSDTTMTNCYYTGNIDAEYLASGLYCGGSWGTNITIEGCYVLSNSIKSAGKTNYNGTVKYTPAIFTITDEATIKDCFYSTNLDGMDLYNKDFSTTNPIINAQTCSPDTIPFSYENPADKKDNIISFQVGISSENSSNINLDLAFGLQNINKLTNIYSNNIDQQLQTIDKMLSTISAKQVEYGACQNRLESALDEISTQYENLVSSRSTLRDADIAKVSSEYIRQQILQQASATLMATANQSPSIALQLL